MRMSLRSAFCSALVLAAVPATAFAARPFEVSLLGSLSSTPSLTNPGALHVDEAGIGTDRTRHRLVWAASEDVSPSTTHPGHFDAANGTLTVTYNARDSIFIVYVGLIDAPTLQNEWYFTGTFT